MQAIVHSVTNYCEFSASSIAYNVNNNIWHKLSTTQRREIKNIICKQLKRKNTKTFSEIGESLRSILNNSD